MKCRDENRYSDPMPWIGLYVTAASIVCLIAMVGDLIHGFRRRKLWFPSKFFSLNATSLAFLAIAMKIPADLNTPMPRAEDQFIKLSGTVLICTAMANFHPSLGTMKDSHVILSVIPLGILVVTVIINVCIQIGTGLIHAFLVEHIITLWIMLNMLLITSCSALTVPTTKQLLKQQYELKHQKGLGLRLDDAAGKSVVVKLKNDVMMAHSCNPQYVISRSVIGTASGVFCFFATSTLLKAFVDTLVPKSVPVCPDQSNDYERSTILISFSQVGLVIIGTVAPACRLFHVVNARSLQTIKWKELKGEFKVEMYWTLRFVEWKDSPLTLEISSRRYRKIVHVSKILVLDVCMYMQIFLVLFCKTVQLISVLSFSVVKRLGIFLFKTHGRVAAVAGTDSVVVVIEKDKTDYVLRLEGEENLVQLIMKQGCEDTEEWVQKGKKNQLSHLRELLKKSNVSEGFKGVAVFDSNRVPSVVLEEPPNCWALPLVTLTSIAAAISCTNRAGFKRLVLGVSEGLKYVRIVEKKLDQKGLASMREAADIVWLCVDLHNQWFDVDLSALGHKEKDPKKGIEHLAEIGKKYALEGEAKKRQNKRTAIKWSPKVLAGNCMYRICQTILKEYTNNFRNVDGLFEWVSMMISDILGACLTNLPRVVYMDCYSNAIKKEDSVREAACLLGETENILEALGNDGIQYLDMDERAYIEYWRLGIS